MGWTVSNYLVTGVPPEPMGDQNATAAPSGTFDAADGPLNIAANRQEQFVTLCDLVDRPVWSLTRGSPTARRASGTARTQPRTQRGAARPDRPGMGADPDRRRGTGGADTYRAAGTGLAQLARGFFTDLPYPDGSGRQVQVTGNGVLVNGEPLRPTAPPPSARPAQR